MQSAQFLNVRTTEDFQNRTNEIEIVRRNKLLRKADIVMRFETLLILLLLF